MNDILEELRVIASDLGKFPTQTDLRELKKFGLCYRIQKSKISIKTERL